MLLTNGEKPLEHRGKLLVGARSTLHRPYRRRAHAHREDVVGAAPGRGGWGPGWEHPELLAVFARELACLGSLRMHLQCRARAAGLVHLVASPRQESRDPMSFAAAYTSTA